MDLREFGPNDATEIGQYADLTNAVTAVDAPWDFPMTSSGMALQVRHGWDGEPGRFFLAESGGIVVGGLEVGTTEYDNRDLAWLQVAVHPDHRRGGHGTALLDAAYDVCRSMGRTLIGADGWDSPAVLGFAAATGFERKSQAICRRQHLADVPPGLVQKVYDGAATHAGDYELVRLEGHSPDELIDEIAAMSASINDAPTDDLEIEDEVYSPERIRAYEVAQIESGRRMHRVLARHRGTGELVGHTVVAVEAERPEIGHQHDTTVVSAHRGHRLGALLKSALLLDLATSEPQLETIDTWNAESNDQMIAVNDLLGYRVMARGLQFQRRI